MATEDSYKARDRLNMLTVVGLALLVGGIVLAAVFLPRTETNAFGDVTESGSMIAVTVGAALAGIGQLLATVGLVGHGVQLGVRVAQGHTQR